MKGIPVVLIILSSMVFTQATFMARPVATYEVTQHSRGDQIEPGAGDWRTWIISSGADYLAGASESRRDASRIKVNAGTDKQ